VWLEDVERPMSSFALPAGETRAEFKKKPMRVEVRRRPNRSVSIG
jgi:hypothetical protein